MWHFLHCNNKMCKKRSSLELGGRKRGGGSWQHNPAFGAHLMLPPSTEMGMHRLIAGLITSASPQQPAEHHQHAATTRQASRARSNRKLVIIIKDMGMWNHLKLKFIYLKPGKFKPVIHRPSKAGLHCHTAAIDTRHATEHGRLHGAWLTGVLGLPDALINPDASA